MSVHYRRLNPNGIVESSEEAEWTQWSAVAVNGAFYNLDVRMARQDNEIGVLSEKIETLYDKANDHVVRITEQNRDLMTLRERVESIAAEVQRMKDKDFPPTKYSNLSNDELMNMLNMRTRIGTDVSDLRAEVRRRLNNTGIN